MEEFLTHAMAEEMGVAEHLADKERAMMKDSKPGSFIYNESLKSLAFYRGMVHAITQLEVRTGWKVDAERVEEVRRRLEARNTLTDQERREETR